MIPPTSALPIGDVTESDAGELRLLLVEDNPGDAVLVREMLHIALEDQVELVHVEALEEACAQVLEVEAGCVLLDLSFPVRAVRFGHAGTRSRSAGHRERAAPRA
jgi:CheY-like chemotaxis protein